MKTCSKCKVEKPDGDFFTNRGNKDRLASWCKHCQYESAARRRARRTPEKRSADLKLARERRNPQRSRVVKRFKNYGITEIQYQSLLVQQKHCCAICEQPLDCSGKRGRRAVNIDHCHLTNRVRGLLCGGCNLALGIFKDSEELLIQAIEYLRKNKTKN